MSFSKAADTFYAVRLARLIQIPFIDWKAYKLGVIDENGDVIQKPQTKEQKNAWTKFHVVARNLKRIVSVAPGGQLATAFGASYLMLKEVQDAYSLSESFPDAFKEAVVAGDSGGSVENIAAGETTGAITSPGPKTKRRKNGKVHERPKA